VDEILTLSLPRCAVTTPTIDSSSDFDTVTPSPCKSWGVSLVCRERLELDTVVRHNQITFRNSPSMASVSILHGHTFQENVMGIRHTR